MANLFRFLLPKPTDIEVVGARTPMFGDLYHFLLRAPWWVDLLLVGTVFIASNLFFAVGYLLVGGVNGAHSNSLLDCFWFSVETMGTIGYGEMHPASHGAHALVTAESLFSILLVALTTGLVFAKFSVPRARMRFARHAVITPFEGMPALMFRLGNERASNLLEAMVRVVVIRTTRTLEGVVMYRMHDLRLERDRSPALTRSWTVIHRITADSPLYGATPESIVRDEMEFILTVTGTDDISAQPMHARHRYGGEMLQWGMRHADILSELPDGRLRADLGQFDALLASEPTADFPYPPSETEAKLNSA
jgi:inward rectifier potassium channel